MSTRDRFLRRTVAWPADHGSWVFLLSPLIIGLAVGGRWTPTVTYLVVASVCGFLVRQPMTVAVKALSGRRSPKDLPAALLWSFIYGSVGLINVLGLILSGMGYLLYLAIPGLAVFAWYLYLVFRRGERRQFFLEVVGAGVFALTAPAGLWAAIGHPNSLGWLLWVLTWAQSAASIIFVYLRLGQRGLKELPTLPRRIVMGFPALAVTSLNLLGAGALGADGWVSQWLWIAYLPQCIEAMWGTWHPAIGYKPSWIGVRQLIVSILYTLLFIQAW